MELMLNAGCWMLDAGCVGVGTRRTGAFFLIMNYEFCSAEICVNQRETVVQISL